MIYLVFCACYSQLLLTECSQINQRQESLISSSEAVSAADLEAKTPSVENKTGRIRRFALSVWGSSAPAVPSFVDLSESSPLTSSRESETSMSSPPLKPFRRCASAVLILF